MMGRVRRKRFIWCRREEGEKRERHILMKGKGRGYKYVRGWKEGEEKREFVYLMMKGVERKIEPCDYEIRIKRRGRVERRVILCT